MKSLKSSVKILIISAFCMPSISLYSMMIGSFEEPSAEFATYVKLLIRSKLNAPVRALMYALPQDEDVKMFKRYIDIVFDNYYELCSAGTPIKLDECFAKLDRKALCKENLRRMFQVSTCQELDNHLMKMGIVYDSAAPCTTWEQVMLILVDRATRKIQIHYSR